MVELRDWYFVARLCTHPPAEKVHTEEETPLNEGNVEINGLERRALIDSGSQITSITHSYWQSHPVLQQQKLQSSKIPIEGAGSQSVPCCGVLRVDLNVFGAEYKAVPAVPVHDSDYCSSVPLLVGTNVIRASRSHLQAAYGQQCMYRVKGLSGAGQECRRVLPASK